MKLNKLSQLILVSSTGLLAASLFTACQIVTVDYVFVASNTSASSSGSDGQIQVFASDSQSGALRTVATAVSSGGAKPVALAVSADYLNLYAANAGGTIVHFEVAASGALTQKEVVTPAGTPAAIAINPAGTYLFAVSSAPATLTVYPLSSGALGTAVASVSLGLSAYPNDTIVPTAVTALANNEAVYVAAYDQTVYNPGGTTTPSGANPGWVFGYTVGSGGALTKAPLSPYQAGVKPSGIAADATSRFVYVTDFASSELIGYLIASNDTLNFMVNGPFKSGNEPNAVVVDPRAKYIYVTNALDNSVTAYEINLQSGTPTAAVNVVGSQTNTTDTLPVALSVEPALGRYVYTANFLGNSISGFRLNPNTGALSPTQATPYPTASEPTAIAAIPHGAHATESVAP
jgi:6-phosphogluconolactonase (cycloisomerase 2 family)